MLCGERGKVTDGIEMADCLRSALSLEGGDKAFVEMVEMVGAVEDVEDDKGSVASRVD